MTNKEFAEKLHEVFPLLSLTECRKALYAIGDIAAAGVQRALEGQQLHGPRVVLQLDIGHQRAVFGGARAAGLHHARQRHALAVNVVLRAVLVGKVLQYGPDGHGPRAAPSIGWPER